jgi:hypothetical protein
MVKRRQKGGGGEQSRPMSGGNQHLNPAPYNPEGAPMAPSNYKTISGGSRKKRRGCSKKQRGGSKRKGKKSKKGGDGGVVSTAIVPFGLLALQRYFKGSKTSKQGVARMGNSVRRTFRRRR